MINDIWGLKWDDRLAPLLAKEDMACCLMHNRKQVTEAMDADVFIGQMKEDVERVLAAGIKKERMIVDPGVGFAKTQEQNLMTIANLDRLKALGYPVLLGTSRKSVIGLTLDLPVDQREEGTLVTTVYGVQKGSAFVRVHDVKKNKRAIQMTKALMRNHEV